jgi:pimeloyl-ACP methyl ester carboxylesterase
VSAPRPRVVLVDGVPMSGLIAVAPDPQAVVVAFHGGSSTAAYFDCPGHPSLSFLRLAADSGYTTVALDRPGYGSSAPYPEAMERPEQRVALAYGAIDKILGSNPRGAGLFLVGHSAGCELVVRMATDDQAARTDLIGLELAGTGVQYDAAMADIMKSATATQRPTGLREVLWQPADLYPPDVLSGMTNSSTGALYEMGMTTSWPRQDFPALAPRVRVPVQFTVAEHERVWRSDPETLAQIGAMFTASPRFAINEQSGTGHNLSLTVNAAAYHEKVLSFVAECVVAHRDTSEAMEAG